MASKRHLRWKSCERKIPYITSDSAYRAIRKKGMFGGINGLHVYKCKWGNHFHIGHLDKRGKQALRARMEAQ